MIYAGVLLGYFLDPVMWVVAIILAYRIKSLRYSIRSFIQVLVGIALVVKIYSLGGGSLNHPLLLLISVIFRSIISSYLIKPAKEFLDVSEVVEIQCEIGQMCIRSYIDSGDVSSWYGAMAAHIDVGRALPKTLPSYVLEYVNSEKDSQDRKDRAQLMLEEISGLDVSGSNTIEIAAMMQHKVKKNNPRLASAIKKLDIAEVRYSLIGRR